MKNTLYIFIFAQLIFSQYILQKGWYFGVNGSYSVPFLFQSNTENKDLDLKSFRGEGSSLGLSVLYKMNKRNYLGLDLNINKYEIKHNSTVFNDSTTSLKAEKDEFYLVRLFYVKKFENNPLFISGGLEAHLPINNEFADYIKDPLRRAQGYASLGLVLGTNQYNLMPYLSYSFPLTKYKSKDKIELNYGEFNIGVKFYLKIF